MTTIGYPIPQSKRPLAFRVSAVLSPVLMVVAGGRLNTRANPLGIIALELAGTEDKARRVIGQWDEATQQRARVAVWVDYLFIAAYSTALSLACLRVSEHSAGNPRVAKVGVALAWGQWIAGLADGLENVGLLKMLQGHTAQPWPRLAQGCAICKFGFVTGGIVYSLLGGIYSQRRGSRKDHRVADGRAADEG